MTGAGASAHPLHARPHRQQRRDPGGRRRPRAGAPPISDARGRPAARASRFWRRPWRPAAFAPSCCPSAWAMAPTRRGCSTPRCARTSPGRPGCAASRPIVTPRPKALWRLASEAFEVARQALAIVRQSPSRPAVDSTGRSTGPARRAIHLAPADSSTFEHDPRPRHPVPARRRADRLLPRQRLHPAAAGAAARDNWRTTGVRSRG